MPRRSQDFYGTLGVPRNAKPDAIRRAYRHLARKLHPDVNPGDRSAEDRFKAVQEAYGVLSDQKKREFYDRHGFYSEQAYSGGGRPAGGRPGGFGFDGFDFTDFGRQAGPGGPRGPDFGSIFETFMGGRGRRRPDTEPKPGEDLEYSLDISFDDAINGSRVRLNVNRKASCGACRGSGEARGARTGTCAVCRGSGNMQQAVGNMNFTVPCGQCRGTGQMRTPCRSCSGEGRTDTSSAISASIPAGTRDNSRVRLPGKGNAGIRGGAVGDLYLQVRVGSHSFFERKGDDIHTEIPVTPAEAILGARVEVPTVDGKALLFIPPATSSGKIFRVRERGVLDPRTKKRGDHFVTISIVVPEIPDETTKSLMRQYAERNPENPRDLLLDSL